MKKYAILSLVAVLFSLFSVTTRAAIDTQILTLSSNSVTITAIAATATNTTVRSTSIVVNNGLDVAIQPSFALAGSGTSAVVFKFDESADGSNWTSATRSISITANGTNTVSKVSNFTVGAVGFLRLSSVENPNGEAVTDIVLKATTKR